MGKALLPLRYFEVDTSGLRAVVAHSESEPLVFDFDLTDEEPAAPIGTTAAVREAQPALPQAAQMSRR